MKISCFPEFPLSRLRRTRRTAWSRRLVRENTLLPGNLVWGLVIREGRAVREPVVSMPGVYRLSPDEAVKAAGEAYDLGIPALALFPRTAPESRTPDGDEALNPENLMCRTAAAIRKAVPDIGLMGDVALDPYTDHGHDGILRDGTVPNDETVEILVRQAVNQAKAGFDIIAPSDMMDGRVGAIRKGLDRAGFAHVQIVSYSAKYASSFYGPYREAIGAGNLAGSDKSTYQMDPANSDEALRETGLDISEGADGVIVKPGIACLDIVRRVKDTFNIPVFAFQVSGEYAMIMAASANGWIDGEKVMAESLLALRRAGADGIITYRACHMAKRLGASPC